MFGQNKKNNNKSGTKRSLRIVSASSSFGYIEAYKALRTNLSYVMEAGGQHSKIVMITSSVPVEGKSNVSINLAVTLAEEHKKVILLDCDLRKGTLHRYLRIPRHVAGITEFLGEEAELKDVILRFNDLGIDVMTAGMVPPNPSELLGSEKMGKLLTALSKEYDYVLCDTPPVNAVTDTTVLSRYADGAVLVVSHNKVTRENVLAAKEQLEKNSTQIFGVVLNMYDAKKTGTDNSKYYSYYNYNYQYGSYNYGVSAGHSQHKGADTKATRKEESGRTHRDVKETQ